jgi:hypothetical protein
MNIEDREAAEAEDAWSKGSQNAAEMSFNNVIRKFTHTDYFPNHRILQSGQFWGSHSIPSLGFSK